MELNIQTPKPNGKGNGHLGITKKSQPVKVGSLNNFHHSIFDPNKYMLKLPKTRKVSLQNGQVRFEKTLCVYNGGTTPLHNLECKAEESLVCLRIQMVL